jgi:uncharacterized membrane protein YozB (DUF420 family)
MTPLTEKQKFNWKALGLGVYLYIFLISTLLIPFAFLGGANGVEMMKGIGGFALTVITTWPYIYLPIQFILYLIARRILKKNSPKSVLKFIYVSFLVIVSFLVLLQIFPPIGWR